MLKGVEEVCFIDSFVVDKENFLDAYKISPESGKLFMYDAYFKDSGKEGGTVYETELGNKLYYSEMQPDSTLSILSRNKVAGQMERWQLVARKHQRGHECRLSLCTYRRYHIYYASDGPGSMGEYDIFVTRYNTNTDSYLMPEKCGHAVQFALQRLYVRHRRIQRLGMVCLRPLPARRQSVHLCIHSQLIQASVQLRRDGPGQDDIIGATSLYQGHMDGHRCGKGRPRKDFGPLPTQSRGLPRSTIFNSSLTTTPPTTSWTISAPRRPKPRMANTISWSRATNKLQEKLEDMRSEYSRANKQEKDKMSAAILDWSNVYGNCPLRWSRLPFKCATRKSKPPNKDNYGYTHYRLIDYRSNNLVLSGIIRNSGHQYCRFSGRRLHHLCQLLCLCLYGHHGSVITLIISAWLVSASLVWFMRSKTLDKNCIEKKTSPPK